MKFKLICFAAIIGIITSCHKPAPRHQNLIMIEDEYGDDIKHGDFLNITFTEKTEDGKVLKGSGVYDDRPMLLLRQKSSFKGDFFEMMSFLSEGDSAQFNVRIDSIIEKTGRHFPAGIKGNYLIYNVRVNEVLRKGNKDNEEYDEEIEAYRLKAFYIERDREPKKITSYIAKNKLKVQKSELGFFYEILDPGNGKKGVPGDTIVVNYTAATLTGKVFETTLESEAKKYGLYRQGQVNKPYSQTLDNKKTKFAFTEALKMFPENSKVLLVIPSEMAFGGEYHRGLPPYTAVVCRLEFLKLKKAG